MTLARDHALLFTDIVDSTRLVERIGDDAALGLWASPLPDRRIHAGIRLPPSQGKRESRRHSLRDARSAQVSFCAAFSSDAHVSLRAA
jgi:hypothetical protein